MRHLLSIVFATVLAVVSPIFAQPADPLKTVVVLVGNSNYDQLPDAPYAHQAVESMADFFVNVEGVPAEHVIRATDLSKGQFDALMHVRNGDVKRRINDTEEVERLVFYYTGHAGLSRRLDRAGDTDIGVLLMVQENPNRLDDAMISRAALLEDLDKISEVSSGFIGLGRKKAEVIVIFDAAFAGVDPRIATMGSNAILANSTKDDITLPINVLMGTRGNQGVVNLDGRQLPLMTAALIDVAQGLDLEEVRDVNLPMSTLASRMDAYMAKLTYLYDSQQSQTSRYVRYIGEEAKEPIFRDGGINIPASVKAACVSEAQALFAYRRSCSAVELITALKDVTCPPLERFQNDIVERSLSQIETRLDMMQSYETIRDGYDNFWSTLPTESRDEFIARDYLQSCDEMEIPEGCGRCRHLADATAFIAQIEDEKRGQEEEKAEIARVIAEIDGLMRSAENLANRAVMSMDESLLLVQQVEEMVVNADRDNLRMVTDLAASLGDMTNRSRVSIDESRTAMEAIAASKAQAEDAIAFVDLDIALQARDRALAARDRAVTAAEQSITLSDQSKTAFAEAMSSVALARAGGWANVDKSSMTDVGAYALSCTPDEPCEQWAEIEEFLAEGCTQATSTRIATQAPYVVPAQSANTEHCQALLVIASQQDWRDWNAASLTSLGRFAAAYQSPEVAQFVERILTSQSAGYGWAWYYVGWMQEQGTYGLRERAQARISYMNAAREDVGPAYVALGESYLKDEQLGKSDSLGAAWHLLALAKAEQYAIRKDTISSAWSRSARRSIQAIMKEAGTYTSGIDGSIGPGSTRAITAWITGPYSLGLQNELIGNPSAFAERIDAMVKTRSSSGSGSSGRRSNSSSVTINTIFGDFKIGG